MKSFVPDVGMITEIELEATLSSRWFRGLLKKSSLRLLSDGYFESKKNLDRDIENQESSVAFINQY